MNAKLERAMVAVVSAAWLVSIPAINAAETVAGVVFVDQNGNGQRDEGEPGLAGVALTDGVQFVLTDANGGYRIVPAEDPALGAGGTPTVSVSFPSGHWPTTPWFYRVTDLKAGATADFGLRPQQQPLPFTFIHGTDPHVPRSGKDKFIAFKQDLAALKNHPAFTILTGDLVDQSDSHTFDQGREEFGFLEEQIKDFPTPLFCLPGNHDIAGVRATAGWDHKHESHGYGFYGRVIGPCRWSFNYAGIHFAGIDFNFQNQEKWGWGTPETAVKWLDQDLDRVKIGTRIFVFVHSPEETNGFAEVIRKHPVTRIFHGHDHRDRETLFAGVRALSSGSVAQVFEDTDRATGYRVVRVEDEGMESFYRATGEPHAVTLDIPRSAKEVRKGGRIQGAFWDPEGRVRRLAFRFNDEEQQVDFERGPLVCRFTAELKLSVPPVQATNFCVIVSESSLAWQVTPFQHSATALVLFDPTADALRQMVKTQDANVEYVPPRAMRTSTGHKENWPGITLKLAEPVDLSRYRQVSFSVRNLDTNKLTVYGRLDNPGADGAKQCLNSSLTLNPGATGELQLLLSPTPWRLSDPVKLVGMRAAPGKSENFDPARVTQMLVFLHEPKVDHAFEIGPVQVSGRVENIPARNFFPFIDELGQFIHADWSGKTKTIADLAAQKRAEQKELTERPGPTDWDEYGGWAEGPELPATGYFRVDKRDGKWWLVTPKGRLFWSQGIDCVTASESTPITDRERYFRGLPGDDEPLGRFYGTGHWAPVGYYVNHLPYKTYDFARANLLRKHGDDWRAAYADMAHRRLRSWGLNTIGNWSDSEVCRLKRTPYTATVSNGARVIEGSEGYWGKFMDVFDPSFRQSVKSNLERHKAGAASDPWCVGFFVDNELSWGDETSLSVAALVSPAEQPAKTVFVADLEAVYGTIDKLNGAWGSRYESWDALRQSREKPDLKKAGADLRDFYTKLAETYFQIVREEVKRVAPNHLYLGCRFAWMNERAMRAAAKYCDVFSCNVYEYTVDSVRLPKEIDKPVIIGEFHFGALDRGMFHTGLKATRNQLDRARKYTDYVKGALAHPQIVGAHWFQYQDQPTTGRGDGENYQIGFVDICDRPYPEIVQASRALGEHLYDLRTGGTASGAAPK